MIAGVIARVLAAFGLGGGVLERHGPVLGLRDVRRFASAFSSRFSSTILSFLVLFAASHMLTTVEYGLYVFLFSIGSALGLIFVLGQQILVVKHYRLGDPDAAPANRALLRVNVFWLGVGVGVLSITAMVLAVLSSRLPSPYDHLDLACLFAAVFALSEFLQNYFRIHGQINLSLIPREIVWRITSAAGLVGIGLVGWLTGGVAAFLAVTLLLAATTAYQMMHFIRIEGRNWRHASPLARHTARVWRTESAFFSLNGILNSCSAYLETIVIGAVIGLDKAAFYFVALRIAMLLTLPVTAIDTVGIPMIAARFQRSDVAGVQRLIGLLSFGSFVISLLGALGLALVSGFTLALFNPEFAQHRDVLIALCISSVSMAFFGPGSWLLMIGGGERFFLIGRTLLFAIYLGLLGTLASLFGLIGIALAGVTLTIASNLIATAWVMRRWDIDNMATAFFKPFGLFDARHRTTVSVPSDAINPAI